MPGDDGELTPEDRSLLKSVGVRTSVSKPLSLWIAQGLFAQYVLFSCFAALSGSSGSLVLGVLALSIAGGFAFLIFAIQRRRRWAHIASSIVLSVVCLSAVASQFTGSQSGPLEIKPAERSGAAVGGVLASLLFGILTVRVAFGAPVREFFASQAPARSDEPA